MRKSLCVATFVAVCGLLIASVSADKKPAASGGVSIGQDAPGFSLTDQNGKTVSLADLKGKTVVLEWFNQTCPFVVRHYKAGTMTNTANKYKDKDVVWLAIDSSKAGASKNKAFGEANHISYSILSDDAHEATKAYGATNTPHMFIINKDGKIAYKGAIDNDPSGKNSSATNHVDAALAEITAGKTVSTPETKAYGCGIK